MLRRTTEHESSGLLRVVPLLPVLQAQGAQPLVRRLPSVSIGRTAGTPATTW